MTKRRYKRPASPDEIASLRRAREASEAEIERLQAQPDTRVVLDQARRIVAAERMDVFQVLLNRKALTGPQFEAARRLEKDMAAAEGVDRAESPLERVDGATLVPGHVYRAIDARARLAAVLGLVGPMNRKLLEALLSPQFEGKPVLWRVVVWKITGESRDEVQTGVVRNACANLAESYSAIDYGKGRAA